MNLNCYDYSPKEEKKVIQDFIDDLDFAFSELSNLYDLRSYQLDEIATEDRTDEDERRLEQLAHVLDSYDELVHRMRVHKEQYIY